MGSGVNVVLQAVLDFCGYALLAVFAQNAVLGRAFGVSRLVKLVDDDAMDSLTFCALLCAVQLLSAPLAFLVNRMWLAEYVNKDFVRPLVLAACTTVSFLVVLVIVAALFRAPRAKRITAVLPMASFNCCIIGTLLITTVQGFTLGQTLGFALGSGLGYSGVVFIVTEGERKLQNDAVPETFRGLPIILLYLAVLSMAAYGMIGHTLSY
ncbi:MAG: NADH:ubiquinone oxidoreductase, subunit RnfA [Ruthenibacterium sp.]